MTWHERRMNVILQAAKPTIHIIMEKENTTLQERDNIMEEAVSTTPQESSTVVEESTEAPAQEESTEAPTQEEHSESVGEERTEEPMQEKSTEETANSPITAEGIMKSIVEHIANCLNADNQLNQSEKTEATELLTQFVKAVAGGSLDTPSLQWLHNALHYDRDLAQAAHDGEVRGRNARIDELLQQHKQSTDIHHLGSTAHVSRPPLPPHIIGGLSAADRQTIWERGREKRVRH